MPPTAPSRARESPVRRPPRRQAGQGLRERLTTERDGYLFYAWGGVVSGALLVAAAWAAWLVARPLTPWAVTAVAAAAAAGMAVDARRRVRRARRDELDLTGELATAEWLGELTVIGYRVFHDLPGERGNIDHAAVGPAGVLVIETKARSRGPGERVEYDGRRLLVGGRDESGRLLGQARACRDEVRQRLRDQSDVLAGLPVRAVLVFPGWDVEEARATGAEVWVLNPKRRVAAWVRQEERREGTRPAAEIELAAAVLDAWAREGSR